MSSGRGIATAVVGLLACVVALLGPAPAADAAGAPFWRLTTAATPTHLPPGGTGTITATAVNLGAATVEASAAHPVTIRDRVPAGITITGAKPPGCPSSDPEKSLCALKWPLENTLHESPVCTSTSAEAACTFEEPLAPFELWEVQIDISVPASMSGAALDEVRVEGGLGPGASTLPPASYSRALEVSGEATPFGVENYELQAEGEDGEQSGAAGSHPFQLTTVIAFNRIYEVFRASEGGRPEPTVPGLARNVHVNLPPGLVGNAEALPHCTELQFETITGNGFANACPADTAIGVTDVDLNEPITLHRQILAVPVFNLAPARGEPARFGFTAFKVPVTLDAAVDGGDFHVVVNVSNISQVPALLSSIVTIWGTPGSPVHDQSRGWCVARSAHAEPGEGCPAGGANQNAFLTLPSSCTGPLQTLVEDERWQGGSVTGEPQPTATLTGCGEVPFSPQMSIVPTETSADTPTGLSVLLKVPQNGLEESGARAESDIRDTEVTLPAGMQLSPSAANGLGACSEQQIGYEGHGNAATGTLEFAAEPAAAPEPCPADSKVGTVRIKTPLLSTELTGSVYLAEQERNPFGSLFAIYVIVKDPTTGVVAKLAGEVKPDPVSGQVTSVFANAPQLPFEEFELVLNKGPRASLATPRACGTYPSRVSFSPWSGGAAVGSAGAAGELEFPITSGAHGTPCASPQAFAPVLSAGAESNQAGAFTPFTLTLGRSDGDQQVKSLSMTLPEGEAAMLANVTRCPEPQANLGTCGEASLIGSATAIAGLGSDPFTERGGRVYVTGPYEGAPFGLSIVIPTRAGPFDFGDVVTRSAIHVDPSTAAITITSALPTMIDTSAHGGVGVPVQLRRVTVTVERPGDAPFEFNPTNCEQKAITGTITGDEGTAVPFSEPFKVTGCQHLAFSPTLEAEVEQHWTKVEGTGMRITVRATPGQANIHKTKIVFPEQLPSRLTTIQKACPEATFDANPASCPEASVIGFAKAVTPVLDSPLAGPAYLVSHGGAEFPDAEFVLQGEGITLILDGQTNIHKGITSSTFNAVPDAPVSTFEVMLPRGPHSAFTGYGELCHATKTVTRNVTSSKTVLRNGRRRTVKVTKKVKTTVSESLKLPTILGGQNEDTIEETLPLKVTGCKAVKSSKTEKKPASAKKAKGRKR